MHTERKKQRGQKRKLKRMFTIIDQWTPNWDSEEPYEHFHVPSDAFIQSKKTSNRNKKRFCEKWLATAETWSKQRADSLASCRVVAMLAIPNLWDSELILFYDEATAFAFFHRNSKEERWIPIHKESLVKRMGIATNLPELGIKCVYGEEDLKESNVLWFYGDVPMLKLPLEE